jgi:hypothetical protein
MRIRTHIRNNVIGYVALFFALCGVAYAGSGPVDGPLPGQDQVGSDDIIDGQVFGKDIQPATIGSGRIVDDSLTAKDLALDSVGFGELDPLAFDKSEIAPRCIRPLGCFFEIPPDAIQTGEIQNGQVQGIDIQNSSITSSDILDGTITGADIQDSAIASSDIENGQVTKADLASNAAPDGYSAFDDNTGIICNDFCTEGSLKSLPAGSYAISAKIEVHQSDGSDRLFAECRLIAGIDSDESNGWVNVDSKHTVTLPMQVVHTFASNGGTASVNCKDFDRGSAVGSHLKITAITLGSLSNVHSASGPAQ